MSILRENVTKVPQLNARHEWRSDKESIYCKIVGKGFTPQRGETFHFCPYCGNSYV